jgi:hypothetical protein
MNLYLSPEDENELLRLDLLVTMQINHMKLIFIAD